LGKYGDTLYLFRKALALARCYMTTHKKAKISEKETYNKLEYQAEFQFAILE
jgi:hypothetical protein